MSSEKEQIAHEVAQLKSQVSKQDDLIKLMSEKTSAPESREHFSIASTVLNECVAALEAMVSIANTVASSFKDRLSIFKQAENSPNKTQNLNSTEEVQQNKDDEHRPTF